MGYLFVAIGGFCGAICRYIVQRLIANHPIPYAILLVNTVGSFLLGLVIGAAVTNSLHLLFGVGFLGAFTTYSTFMVDCIQLFNDRKWKDAATYIVGNYLGGLICAFLGIMIGRW